MGAGCRFIDSRHSPNRRQTVPERPLRCGKIPARTRPREAPLKRVFSFVYPIRQHVVIVAGDDGNWVVTVDGTFVGGRYLTKPDAWAAGVNEADLLDRCPPLPGQAGYTEGQKGSGRWG
jgi:hypothetical protein